MPAMITHYLIGEDIIKKCGLNFNNDERIAFDLALQGGDIFFYYIAFGGKKYPLLRKLGEKLHKQYINGPVYYMNEFANTLKNKENKKIVEAYIMGYICHHAMDSTAHPYIYFLSEKLWEQNNEKYDKLFYHTKAEANIDVLLLKEFRNKTVKDVKPYKLFPIDKKVTMLLGKMYSYAIEKIQYTVAPYEEYQKAFYFLQKGMRALYGPGSFKRNFIFSLSNLVNVSPAFSQMVHPQCCDGFCDYMNTKHEQFKHEDGFLSTDSFIDIYNKAVDKAEDHVNRYNNGENICDILEGRSFDSGIIVDDNKYNQ